MLVNRFDIIDAMIYASNNEDANIFLKLEILLMKQEFPVEEILIVEEELLDYIEKVNRERYSLVEIGTDTSKGIKLAHPIDDENLFPSLYNCNITDFYEDSHICNLDKVIQNKKIKQRKNTKSKF